MKVMNTAIVFSAILFALFSLWIKRDKTIYKKEARHFKQESSIGDDIYNLHNQCYRIFHKRDVYNSCFLLAYIHFSGNVRSGKTYIYKRNSL